MLIQDAPSPKPPRKCLLVIRTLFAIRFAHRRKIYTPLPKTVLTLGADYNTQLGVWQFRSDWEDKVIGGRLR